MFIFLYCQNSYKDNCIVCTVVVVAVVVAAAPVLVVVVIVIAIMCSIERSIWEIVLFSFEL